jgi:lysozyme
VRAAIDLISEFEGFSAKPYLCPAGKWTIGFGSTMWKGKPVTSLTKPITRLEAESGLANNLIGFQKELDSYVSAPLNTNENAALLSFIYNIGARKFRESTLLKKLNAGDKKGAADEFLRWNKIGKKESAGLSRRRIAERELFLTPVKG